MVMYFIHSVAILFVLLCIVSLKVDITLAEGIRLPDQPSIDSGQIQITSSQLQKHHQQQQHSESPRNFGEERNGRLSSSILSIFGLGSTDTDPYLSRTNSNCLNGDLSECFKTQALNSFDEIFYREHYTLTDLARIVRLPENQQRSLLYEPFEYSEEPRDEDTDWDQLLKYALRRAERFIKSTALEVQIPEDLTESGRYEARFIGTDIDSELDILEDKRAPIIKRKKLKRLIIPLLLVLKIFKLKLLLFLPFILGIVGLKKVLALAAIILPGIFAYFKLCQPQGGLNGGGGIFSGLFNQKHTFPEYTSQGIGSANYYHHHEHYEGGHGGGYRPQPYFSKPYTDYYSKNLATSNAVSFGDDHEAAYNGYYGRSASKDVSSTQKT